MTESIVLTGGPCGGKSSALPFLKTELEKCGWRVLTVGETATDLMQSGVTPFGMTTPSDYQRLNTDYMLFKHNLFFKAADIMPNDKPTVVIFDRGINDCLAYAEWPLFEDALKKHNTSPIVARDRYGAVFHMTTAADGAEECYTLKNNSVRTETPEQAVALDRKTLSCWVGHPHLRVIGNHGDFEQKLDHLLAEVKAYLGIPTRKEIERKFLIEYPDFSNVDLHSKVDITQLYLTMTDGSKSRIRKRGLGNDAVYIKTEKQKISDTERIETEDKLTKVEFDHLSQFADKSRQPINKTRHLVVWKEKYFEIDVFPFWQDKAVLEIELLSSDEPFEIPPFVKVIKEVTEDSRYTNASLAKEIPNE